MNNQVENKVSDNDPTQNPSNAPDPNNAPDNKLGMVFAIFFALALVYFIFFAGRPPTIESLQRVVTQGGQENEATLEVRGNR